MTIGVKLGTEPVGANGVKIVSSDGLKIAFLSLARFRGYKGRARLSSLFVFRNPYSTRLARYPIGTLLALRFARRLENKSK